MDGCLCRVVRGDLTISTDALGDDRAKKESGGPRPRHMFAYVSSDKYWLRVAQRQETQRSPQPSYRVASMLGGPSVSAEPFVDATYSPLGRR